MIENIRLLEVRVSEAAKRLHLHAEERKKLEDEIESLRRALESRGSNGSDDDPAGPAGWRARCIEAVGVIRETLAEIKET